MRVKDGGTEKKGALFATKCCQRGEAISLAGFVAEQSGTLV